MKYYLVQDPEIIQSERTHLLSDERLTQFIGSRGITMIANMWHSPDPRAVSLVRIYRHVYIPDGKLSEDMIRQCSELADEIASEIRCGGRALIHCWGGKNRSGLVSAMTLIRLHKMTGAKAVETVRKARRGALSNNEFRAYLEGLM